MKYIKTFEQFINESVINEKISDKVKDKIEEFKELEKEIRKYSISVGLSGLYPEFLNDDKWLSIQNRWMDRVSNFYERIGDVERNKNKNDDDYQDLIKILNLIHKTKEGFEVRGEEKENVAITGFNKMINNYKKVLTAVKGYYNKYGKKVSMKW